MFWNVVLRSLSQSWRWSRRFNLQGHDAARSGGSQSSAECLETSTAAGHISFKEFLYAVQGWVLDDDDNKVDADSDEKANMHIEGEAAKAAAMFHAAAVLRAPAMRCLAGPVPSVKALTVQLLQ